MDRLNSIVVGVDFTPCAASALREAVRIARWNGSTLRAVHVIGTLVAAELEEALSGFQTGVRESLIRDAEKAWALFAAGVEGAAGAPMDVVIDARVAGILEAVRRANADLLVVGAAGPGSSSTGFSTVSTSCVRHAPCRVLLVRDRQTSPFRAAVACVDFSPTSLEALGQAARICAQDGAALHVLHIFDPAWRQLHYRAPTPEADPAFQRQYRAALERRLREFASTVLDEIPVPLPPVFAVYEYGGHRSGIVEYARDAGVDLIVLGTRGHSSIRDYLLGSTAEKVLRESPCSVLAVPPLAESARASAPAAI